MPDIRYALRNGDITSTNGRLIAVGHAMIHHGVTVGVEGDYATCPACNDGGPVLNNCHPSFNIMGKQILVSGARVYCKCEIKPRVFHSQTDFTIEVTRSGRRDFPDNPAANISQMPDDGFEILEQFFEIKDEYGSPIEGYRYDLFMSGAQIAKNAKMIDGRTISVDGDRDVCLVMWLDKKGQECA